MTQRFEDYQIEELMKAHAYLAQDWGQKYACSNEPLEVLVLPEETPATFYGLTHDTHSVCAVVRLDDEPFVHLVHYSQVVLLRRAYLPQDRCQCENPKHVEGSVLCGTCKGNLLRSLRRDQK